MWKRKSTDDFKVLIDDMKTIMEDLGKQLMKVDDMYKLPADVNMVFNDLGAAVHSLTEPYSKMLLKSGEYHTRHHLYDGRMVTEAEVEALEAEIAEELKDEVAVVLSGAKDIIRLLRLFVLTSADKVKGVSDKMKDLEFEEAMKMIFDPQIQVTPEEEENKLEEDAWLLIDM